MQAELTAGRVDLRAVEAALRDHPSVDDCGVPGQQVGQVQGRRAGVVLLDPHRGLVDREDGSDAGAAGIGARSGASRQSRADLGPGLHAESAAGADATPTEPAFAQSTLAQSAAGASRGAAAATIGTAAGGVGNMAAEPADRDRWGNPLARAPGALNQVAASPGAPPVGGGLGSCKAL